ncbi:MAG: Sec-independent protein translocase protein TatB, partial [Psychromonas sp.]|nr:Sec-independent protein translocase protein TatB [Psychromonas sp.]
MFDIGFWEIVLISIIGLIVLGPERLPIAIRTVTHAIKTIKRMSNALKTEISQELKRHDIDENTTAARWDSSEHKTEQIQDNEYEHSENTAEQLHSRKQEELVPPRQAKIEKTA